jgi:hypothetical protein
MRFIGDLKFLENLLQMIVYCSWCARHDDRCFPARLALGRPLQSLPLTRRERIGPHARPCSPTMSIHSLPRVRRTQCSSCTREHWRCETSTERKCVFLMKDPEVPPIKTSRLNLARLNSFADRGALRRVAAVWRPEDHEHGGQPSYRAWQPTSFDRGLRPNSG